MTSYTEQIKFTRRRFQSVLIPALRSSLCRGMWGNMFRQICSSLYTPAFGCLRKAMHIIGASDAICSGDFYTIYSFLLLPVRGLVTWEHTEAKHRVRTNEMRKPALEGKEATDKK